MNLQHLKFAVKAAEFSSFNKAADALYVSQPNLSRAIRELEQELGITLFKRTPQGVRLTFAGEDFLVHARIILDEVEQIERLSSGERTLQRFSLCVPRAGYISNAFTRFLAQLDNERKMLVDFKETGAIGALQNLLNGSFQLGILRYQKAVEPYFQAMLQEQGLSCRSICNFTYVAAMSKFSPLAQQNELYFQDLKSATEITHGDSYLLSSVRNLPDQETEIGTDRRIHVYDSMGQLAMLGQIPDAFMMVYPLEEELLERYQLVQKPVVDFAEPCCDVLIHRKNYHFSALDKLFLKELDFARKENQ